MNDLRYASRLLRRDVEYAPVAILTTAVGIGATTTLCSVAYGVLLKPLPWAGAVNPELGRNFGRAAGSPWLVLAAPLLLLIVASVTCYLPARRSSTIDPLITLRDE